MRNKLDPRLLDIRLNKTTCPIASGPKASVTDKDGTHRRVTAHSDLPSASAFEF